MAKPVVTDYQGSVAPVRASRAKGLVSIETNAPVAISSALYYELMVAHEAVTGNQMDKWLDQVWKTFDKQIGEYVDRTAQADPGRLHHVYEWNQVGNPGKRLWKVKRSKQTTDGFKISYNFIQSRTRVPINPILKTPGPTGKVVTKSGIFRRKAFVMEEGTTVTMKAVNGNYMAIPTGKFRGYRNKNGIAFSKGPVTNKFPGGRGVKYGFARTMNGYFQSGLATKNLKASGVLDRPIKTMQRAGTRIPVTISHAGMHRTISKSAVEAMAKQAVRAAQYGW